MVIKRMQRCKLDFEVIIEGLARSVEWRVLELRPHARYDAQQPAGAMLIVDTLQAGHQRGAATGPAPGSGSGLLADEEHRLLSWCWC